MSNPTFKRLVKGLAGGKKLEPLILNALHNPKYKPFDVHMRASKGETRKPDNWFHPSTHPLWEERQLYYYLAEPDKVIPEDVDYIGRMAMTGGTFFHAWISHVLMEAGILSAIDVKVVDLETGSRGEMDGVFQDEAWEFKTMNGMKMKKILDGPPDDAAVLASFKKLCPTYWAQAQEYMRLSGYTTMRMTILEASYPFMFREIAIPYSPHDALPIRDKYLSVRQAVADQRVPDPCCAPGSATARVCFARGVCPIGLMTK